MAEKKYDPSIWEIGIGVPGAQEGIETLFEDYAAPWWRSYDELENPAWSRTKDAAKFGINTLWDAAKFTGDVGWDVLQALDAAEPKWLGGQGRPTVSTKGKYLTDAFLQNTVGFPSAYKDNANPYTNPEIQAELTKQSESYADAYVRDNVVTESGEKKARAAANKKITWNKWIKDNPNVQEGEGGYEKYMDDFYEARDNKFFEELWNTYGSKWDEIEKEKYDDLLRVNYGIGADESSFSEFELLKDESGKYAYAWDENPLLEYETPREDILYDAHMLSDLLVGPGVVKAPFSLGRRLFKGSKRADEGIMGVKRIEDADKYRYAEEWLRTGGR